MIAKWTNPTYAKTSPTAAYRFSKIIMKVLIMIINFRQNRLETEKMWRK